LLFQKCHGTFYFWHAWSLLNGYFWIAARAS
jgi:hypothetical protein